MVEHLIMIRRFLIAPLLLFVALASGCDLFGEDEQDPLIVTESVVVANGGNFSDQNGYLSFYDPENGTVSNSQDLGGFAHATAIHEEEIYVLLNTFSTGRISVVDVTTGAVSRQIQNVPGPRGIAFAGADQAMVSNLSPFGETGPGPAVVSVVDLSSGTVQGDGIEVGIYPEGLAAHDGIVYVANSGNLGDGTTLSVINASSKQVSGTIELGCDGPNEVFVDEDDELLVVCEGKVVYNEDFSEIIDQTPGQILAVSPSSRSVVSRVILPTQAGSENGSQSAYYEPAVEELYVINSSTGTIYRYETDSNALATSLQIPDATDLVGLAAVAYDGVSSRLYVARLARGAGGFPDFSAAGAVIVLDRSGTQLDRFTVGPAPTHIEFLHGTP